MLDDEDFEDFRLEFFAIMEYQGESLAIIDQKLEHIARVLQRTEWKIKHFGEAWPDDV